MRKMTSTRKHPSVLSYLFHPVVMAVGVIAIGVFFGIQQKETVAIVKQLPTVAQAKVFCEKPLNGFSSLSCFDNYVALDQFVSVVRDEIEPNSLKDCFSGQYTGDPEAAWRCLRSVDGKALHTQYKSPLKALGS